MPPEWSPRTVTFLGIRSRWLQSVILGIATLFAVASLGNVVYRGYVEGGFTGPRWGNDLDQWWAGGRLLLQGQNPYATKVPSAAPVLLLLTPLAALPWLAASVLWAVANLVLAVGCVWLMLRLNGGRLGSLAGALCLARPLAQITLSVVGLMTEKDLLNQIPSLPQVKDGACLVWLWGAGAATAANTTFAGGLEFVHG